MAQLFLTIGSEEIPARMQQSAGRDLERLLVSALDEAAIAPSDTTAYWGPRHIAVRIDTMLAQQPDREIEKRGPRIDAPDKAIDGFCQSVGMSRDELTQEDTGKGTFFFARKSEKGQPAETLLPEIVNQILSQFPWPKSQRWGTSRKSWVRPMHHIGLLLDGKIVEGAFDLGGDMHIAFSNQATGHPFHKNETFTFDSADSWSEQMRDHFVLADAHEKTELIKAEIAAKTKALGIEVIPDEGLLAEVTGLVEWPNIIIGNIAPEHMELPEEVLITSMRVHQKYFATRTIAGDNKGAIAPYFITVANRLPAPETDKLIQQGNERVLRARLADAAFFYQQDKAQPLSDNLPALDNITFYEGLGSVGDKVKRMTALAQEIASHITGANPEAVKTAAQLAKTDLVTDMVGEFPELQGLMGGYYATHHGYDNDISTAIAEHYKPVGASDTVPSTPTALAVSLADKIDTLVGFFGVGAKPTGSKDPFALRRAALGILRMIDECDIALPLSDICKSASKLHGFDTLDDDVSPFIKDRLSVMLRDGGKKEPLPHDVVLATLSTAGIENPRLMMRKAAALKGALDGDEGAKLIAGFKRANNILSAEVKKSQDALPTQIDAAHFIDEEEKALFTAIEAIPTKAVESEADLMAVISSLASLAKPIDNFFEQVIVNHEDEAVRANRLALLNRIISQMGSVADFSKIER